MNKISTIIKRHRQLNDMQQRELAAEIGILPSTLNRLEKGKHASQDTMVKLIVWLFSEAEEKEKPDEPDILQLSPPTE